MDTEVSDVGVYSSIENAEKAQRYYEDLVKANECLKGVDYMKYGNSKVNIHGNEIYLCSILDVCIAEYVLDDFTALKPPSK